MGGRPCEVMTSLLAVSTTPISAYEEPKDEEVKESKFDDDEEGKEGEGGGGGGNSAAQPRHLPLSFFAKLINTPVASTKLPPYTNILLTSILLLQSLEQLKGTDPLAYISLRANLKDGQTLLPLALTTHTKTLGLPPPTPAVDFTWVLYLGKTVLPSVVEIGKVLKEGNEVRVEAVEVETRGGSNAVESMHDDVLAKIQILGNAVASSTSLVGGESRRRACMGEADDAHLPYANTATANLAPAI